MPAANGNIAHPCKVIVVVFVGGGGVVRVVVVVVAAVRAVLAGLAVAADLFAMCENRRIARQPRVRSRSPRRPEGCGLVSWPQYILFDSQMLARP